MSVRELIFDIGFKGDATAILKADNAVTGFKNSIGKVGVAADASIGQSIKGFENLGDSISKSSKETISFTKDMRDMVSRSGVVQNLKTVGNSAKTHIADTLTKVAKTTSDKMNVVASSVRNSLGKVFPETSKHGRVTIGILNDIGNAGKNGFTSIKTHVEKALVASQKLSRDLDTMSQKLDNISKGSGKLGDNLTTRVSLPLVAAAGASFKFASDLQENMGKTEQVFEDQSSVVMNWSKSSLKNFGMARSTALDMASLYGDMGTGMGMATKDAANMSMNLTGLAADISSFKNVGLEQSQNALKGIYTGETESLKNLGIVMTETNLSEYAMAQGIKKKVTEMSQAEKVQLRYNYVMDMTKNAHGDFARTGGNAANQMRGFSEGIKELATGFGNLLLPVITPAIQKANDFIVKLQEMDDGQRSMILKFGAFAIAAGPMFKIFSLATLGLSKFTKGLSFLLKFNTASIFTKMGVGIARIGGAISAIKGLGFAGSVAKLGGAIAGFGASILPIILIIGSVVAAGYLLYKNWDLVKAKGIEFVSSLQSKFTSFVPVVQNIWSNIQTIFNALLPVFSGVLSGIGMMLGSFIMTATTLVGNIITVFSGITDFLVGVFTGNWAQAFSGIKQIFSGTFKAIETIFKGSINFIAGGINSFISGINGIKIPDWVPGVGGKKFSIPLIPGFAKGVDNFGGGLAVVGEKGPELLNLPTGSSVTSNAKTQRLFDGSVSKLSNEADKTWGTASNINTKTYIFSPSIEIHTSSDKPEEIADVTKNKVKDWFEEWIDDADIAS